MINKTNKTLSPETNKRQINNNIINNNYREEQNELKSPNKPRKMVKNNKFFEAIKDSKSELIIK